MYFALDIGGTNLRISSFNTLVLDSFINKISFQSSDFQNYDYAIKTIAETIKKEAANKKILGLGISMTGRVNPVVGQIGTPDAFPNWHNKFIANDLNKILNCPVKIENDAVCAGVSEKVFGLGKNLNKMAFVIVGTGVGAVRLQNVADKTIIFPTEFGHIPIVPDGEICTCGKRGHIEAYVSGQGIRKFYNTSAEKLKSKEAWVVISRLMTQAIMNFLVMHQVETFIFGGGLAINQGTFIVNLVKNIELMLSKKYKYDIPSFFVSQFGDNAGTYGALALLDNKYDFLNIKFN